MVNSCESSPWLEVFSQEGEIVEFGDLKCTIVGSKILKDTVDIFEVEFTLERPDGTQFTTVVNDQ